MLLRNSGQDSLNARLDGPDGSHIAWSLNDPVDSDGWGASRIAMVTELLPHIRQFVRVRQALVRAEARNTTVTALLDNPRVGVLHLDRRGRIIEANDRARSILRHGDGLANRDGMLRARATADQVRLERLVARLVEASVSPNTRRAYAGALRRLDAWLDGRPLHDVTLAAYLAELHDAGLASSSASMAVAAACFRRSSPGSPLPPASGRPACCGRVPAHRRRAWTRTSAGVRPPGPGGRARHVPPAAPARARRRIRTGRHRAGPGRCGDRGAAVQWPVCVAAR